MTTPRIVSSLTFAVAAIVTFLIPLVLIVYVGHAYFYGPAWMAASSHLRTVIELVMVLFGFIGLFVQWILFWLMGFVLGTKARYEWRYYRYLRAGKDPHDWGRVSLS